MPSQHRHKGHGFRPDPADFEAASGHLEERDRTMGAYLRASVRWLARDPDAALAAVEADWPERLPPGWPHIAPTDTGE
jgi:hypothetical protein